MASTEVTTVILEAGRVALDTGKPVDIVYDDANGYSFAK
jgi:hypothetical protein